MKKEMRMLDNGNYEEVISPIQHSCYSKDIEVHCVEYSWKGKQLFLKIESGDPYEDGFAKDLEINFCPFCGYNPNNLTINS